MAGKVALVTGGGSGIGAASAATYAREGASVVIVDINAEAAARVAEQINISGGNACALTANVGELTDIENMIAFAIDEFSQLDVLHNNTTNAALGPLGEVETDQFQASFDIGLRSFWYASKHALKHMVPRGGGTIVNTASISGLAADYGLGAYNIMKSGVIAMTRSIAIDYARKGIRCNAICPGIIFTPPFESMRKNAPERIAAMADSVPMGRFGNSQEVANVALFLASDESSYMTGTTLVVDGGRLAYTGTPGPTGFGPDWV
ncbi:SDR family NAD(P)-dependent oxidoreductase [Pseudomonas sp. 9AZ]|uniref:SDR family NAD(P)-dependent oxidoreductase n=1 Tax=Pseudomonas sp. 9AZ TaxID=2653168 RepID=UPI001358BF7A|nr:SDR family NAD(P)-dependent oxidoreductase [Pseudomonas sp. 9AZ]